METRATQSSNQLLASVGSGSKPAAANNVEQNAANLGRQVENFYATLLEQFGQQGFVSAQPIEPLTITQQSVRETWNDWYSQVGYQSYSFQAGSGSPSVRANKTSEDLRLDYGSILVDAYQNGAYAAPLQYLQSLDRDQLRVLQQVHHLAEPIDAEQLSEESSLNLLLPPPTQIDQNHDGLTAVGAAYTIRFPTSDTPGHIRDAWEKVTANLNESDKAIYTLQMNFSLITANLHTDAQGNFVRASQPGDDDWVNPMASPNFSYSNYADQWLSYLREFKNQMEPAQFARDQQFWTSFRNAIEQA